MSRPGDAAYYGELGAGAEYLATGASDPAERAVHLNMARVYRGRARDAAGSAPDLEGDGR